MNREKFTTIAFIHFILLDTYFEVDHQGPDWSYRTELKELGIKLCKELNKENL